MLILDNVDDLPRSHPFQRVQALRIVTGDDTLDECVRLAGAERIAEQFANIVLGVDTERCLVFDIQNEDIEDPVGVVAANALQCRHRAAELMDLIGFHVLQHLGRLGFAEGHQQQSRSFSACHVFRNFSHRSIPTS